MLVFHNTLSGRKEDFKPLKDKKVGMYSCGPTVYNYAHIGNLRSFIFSDVLKRYLKYRGYDVKHVMNITDVDDKTIRDSKKEGKTLKDFTEFYTKEFFKDFDTLNISRPDIIPKATESIPGMVDIVKRLKKKGHTYEKDGSTYFRISTMKDYGKLAKLDLSQLKDDASGRLDADEYEKEDAKDFVLWKAWSEDDGDTYWETDIGKGRPGWHIECSAMSSKHLGETFDIHTGGVDLIFPHHENEIAQSECASGKPFVKYWIHCEHLLVDGKKMSKSLGNFYTLRDVLKKGYDPKAIRYELLATHYRQKLNFTFKGVDAAKHSLERLQDFISSMQQVRGKDSDIKKLIEKAEKGFTDSMDDDLNISEALAAIFAFVKDVNKLIADGKVGKKNAKEILDVMKGFDLVIGVLSFEKESLDSEIEALIEKREEARKSKDFSTADKIRDGLKEKGIVLEDTKEGVRWKRAQ